MEGIIQSFFFPSIISIKFLIKLFAVSIFRFSKIPFINIWKINLTGFLNSIFLKENVLQQIIIILSTLLWL